MYLRCRSTLVCYRRAKMAFCARTYLCRTTRSLITHFSYISCSQKFKNDCLVALSRFKIIESCILSMSHTFLKAENVCAFLFCKSLARIYLILLPLYLVYLSSSKHLFKRTLYTCEMAYLAILSLVMAKLKRLRQTLKCCFRLSSCLICWNDPVFATSTSLCSFRLRSASKVFERFR